jgi:hypothetical protein
MSPHQKKQKEEAMRESEHHHRHSAADGKREKSADELNRQRAERFREYNEPDKSVFGSVGSELRQDWKRAHLRAKYAKEDEGR